MTSTHPLEWLVLRAQSGDRGALESLLLDTQRRLSGYVVGILGDTDLASDVLQEVLVTIYRKLGTLQEPRAYGAWTRRIASRAVFAALRRERQHAAIHEQLEPDAMPAGELLDDAAAITHDLPRLLERVSPASREVLVLHYLQALPLEEIATTLDLPLGTVKSRLGYGLRALRRLRDVV